jgi:hypothetical protein
MSFLRHQEIYRPDVRLGQKLGAATRVAAPVLIGCDEFPVGYSLAGCPPAEPASASPTGDDSQQSTLPYNDFSANGNYPLNFLSQSKGALQTFISEMVSRRIDSEFMLLPHEIIADPRRNRVRLVRVRALGVRA